MAGKIFLTGDTHGFIDSRKLWKFASLNPDLSKEDYLIVLGDFGFIWDGSDREIERLAELEKLPFTTLFLCGNHENFDLLEQYEKTMWRGGTVQFVSDSIIHLCRGQVFTISGKKFFVMGGATSIDFELRTEGESWWQQEDISDAELDEGFRNLAANDNTVDYVLTHCAPTRYAQEIIENGLGERHHHDVNEMHLEDFRILPLNFTHWYCGHYHVLYESSRFTCLYNEVVELI